MGTVSALRKVSLKNLWTYVVSIGVFACVFNGIDASMKPPKYFIHGDTNGCEAIVLPMCANQRVINYNTTTYPNRIGHRRQSEAFIQFQEWRRYVYVGCSAYIRPFLCLAFAPKCDHLGKRLDPCQSLCKRARKGCYPLFKQMGQNWPSYMSCEKFPRDGKEICVGKSGAIVYPEQSKPNIKEVIDHKGKEKHCPTGIAIDNPVSGVQFHQNFPGSRIEISLSNEIPPSILSFDFKSKSSESQLLMLLTNTRRHHYRSHLLPDFFAIYISNWGFPRITCSFRCGRLSGVMADYRREILDDHEWHSLTFNPQTSMISYDHHLNAVSCGMPEHCHSHMRYMYMGGLPERFLPKALLKEKLPARTLKGCVRKLRFGGQKLSLQSTFYGVSTCC